MKVTFRAWNHGYTELQSEGDTLSRLDGYNKTRYSRRKKQEGLLELASREAHEQQNVYFATILNEDDSPYCAIESNVGYFGLDFLRDNYDDYLTFQYREQLNQDGKLFLKAIFLFECYPGTDKRMRRIDFSYTHEGGCSSVIYQGEAYDGTFEMITTEHPPSQPKSWSYSGWTIRSLGNTTNSYAWIAFLCKLGNVSSNILTRSFLRLGSISNETSNVIKNLRSKFEGRCRSSTRSARSSILSMRFI